LVNQFLDYAATHPNAIITNRASDMVLAGHSHSDASYLLESNTRSRAGGHFFMSNDDTIPSNNGATLIMSSAAEAKIGAFYINCKVAIPARHALEFLGHKQTTHTNANRQHYRTWSGKQQRYEKIKVDGHEIPLASMPNKPTSFPPLLGGGQIKQQ
jgi:ribosomal protein L21